jgi:hypothetical protein
MRLGTGESCIVRSRGAERTVRGDARNVPIRLMLRAAPHKVVRQVMKERCTDKRAELGRRCGVRLSSRYREHAGKSHIEPTACS